MRAMFAYLGLVALLYYLCFVLLAGLVLFVVVKAGRRTRPRLRRTFFLLAMSLLLWQLTLFLEIRTALPIMQLWLGRVNFAAVAFAAYLALRFVQEVPVKKSVAVSSWRFLLLGETVVLAVFTLFTPLIDAAERVEPERAVTTFGPLFPCYLVHILGYQVGALVQVFRGRRRSRDRKIRRQLTLIGIGMLITGAIAMVTNALLPYGYGDFRFCDIGALSTLFFVLSIAYATFVHRLFDLGIVLRETLVYGILMTFVVGVYSSAVLLFTQYVTEGAGQLMKFAVLLIAFSFDPLRRFLEKKTDGLLFGSRGSRRKRKKRRSVKPAADPRGDVPQNASGSV